MPSAPGAARRRAQAPRSPAGKITLDESEHTYGVGLTCKQAQRFDFLYHRISLNGSLVGGPKTVLRKRSFVREFSQGCRTNEPDHLCVTRRICFTLVCL